MSSFLDNVQLPGGAAPTPIAKTPASSGFLSKVQTPQQIQASQDQVKQAQAVHAFALTAPDAQPIVKFEAPQVVDASAPKAPALSSVFPQTVQTIKSIIPDLTNTANIKKTGVDMWNAIKDPILAEGQNIKDLFDAGRPGAVNPAGQISAFFKGIAGAGNILFSPITALFAGAKDIPVLGSVADLVAAPFVALGEAGTGISNTIVENLPISQAAKQQIAPGLGQIFALAAQIELGAKVDLIEKTGELIKKFGSTDAKTIVDTAQKLAEHKTNLNPDTTQASESKFISETKPAEPSNVPIDRFSGAPVHEIPIEDIIPTERGTPKPETIAAVVKSGEVNRPIELKQEANGKFSIIDGANRLEGAKQAGLDKIPAILQHERPSIVPRELLLSNGKEVPNTRAITLEKAAVEKKLTESLGDLPTHNQMDMKEQASKAVDYIDKNPEHALKVAKGEAISPPDILPESLYTALEARAIETGDVNLMRELKDSSLPTLAGQSLKALDSVDPNSPVKIMRDIEKSREGEIKPTEVKKDYNNIKKEIKQAVSKRPTWEAFIDQLKCNE